MPGLRNEEDKRARLIRAVGETLAEYGYQGLGLNKIALRAGVSKPMVYRYFGGLNGLLKAYIEVRIAGCLILKSCTCLNSPQPKN